MCLGCFVNLCVVFSDRCLRSRYRPEENCTARKTNLWTRSSTQPSTASWLFLCSGLSTPLSTLHYTSWLKSIPRVSPHLQWFRDASAVLGQTTTCACATAGAAFLSDVSSFIVLNAQRRKKAGRLRRFLPPFLLLCSRPRDLCFCRFGSVAVAAPAKGQAPPMFLSSRSNWPTRCRVAAPGILAREKSKLPVPRWLSRRFNIVFVLSDLLSLNHNRMQI